MMKIGVIALLGFVQLSSATLRGTLQKDFGEAVLKELEEALGSSDHREQTEQQLHKFEDELRTTFKALPKNSRGALEGPYARYALHRLFVQRYGWQVKGLEMTSGAWYAGAGVGVLGDRVPPKMKELFERRLGRYGLVLHELAVLAATLDAMFRSDVYDRLKVVYAAFEQNTSSILDHKSAYRIGHAYMSALILGQPVEELHASDVMVSARIFPQQERSVQIENLLQETMGEFYAAGAPRRKRGTPASLDWELMTSWLLRFGQRLGHLEDQECKAMKTALLLNEADAGTGRVRLVDFHASSDSFEEQIDDLRSMEALDETDPDDPKVIIPNYLQGATNCISPAGYYSICCFDECEELMDKIEAHFEAPAASPGAIASFIASLPSASVVGNRSLSPGLLEALNLMAMDQGGMVPLHSKHFAEWMHQAYPRECSHPQQSNSDRFNQTLRHFIDEIKAAHTQETGIEVVAPDQSRSVVYEIFITVALGFVGMTLARMIFKGGRSSRGKFEKQL